MQYDDTLTGSFSQGSGNTRYLLLRQQSAVDAHFVLWPSIILLPPPMRHAAAVTASVERKIALAIFIVALVALQPRVWGCIDIDVAAGEVGPESTVFVADSALTLVKLVRFRRERNLNTAAVALYNQRLDTRRVDGRCILGRLALC